MSAATDVLLWLRTAAAAVGRVTVGVTRAVLRRRDHPLAAATARTRDFLRSAGPLQAQPTPGRIGRLMNGASDLLRRAGVRIGVAEPRKSASLSASWTARAFEATPPARGAEDVSGAIAPDAVASRTPSQAPADGVEREPDRKPDRDRRPEAPPRPWTPRWATGDREAEPFGRFAPPVMAIGREMGRILYERRTRIFTEAGGWLHPRLDHHRLIRLLGLESAVRVSRDWGVYIETDGWEYVMRPADLMTSSRLYAQLVANGCWLDHVEEDRASYP